MMVDGDHYESPQLVVSGTIEDITLGTRLAGGDVVLFYREF